MFFVRHGKDDARFRGGWSNLDLIPAGIEQTQRLAAYLFDNNSSYRITRIISSDLPRTMTTAHIISDLLHLPVEKVSKLREIDNGDLAGIPNEIAFEQYPGLFFNTLGMDEAYPNGESPRNFYRRIQNWFLDFCSDFRDIEGNALVVTHGGVINVIYHLVKGIEWSNKNPSFPAANCSIHILNIDTMEFEEENNTDFL